MMGYATGAIFPYTHPLPSARGVLCRCGEDASHKVEEVTDDYRHPLTSYLCCRHFGDVMGPLAQRLCIRATT